MRFVDINKSMNYLTKRFGSEGKNAAVNIMGLITCIKESTISNKDEILEYLQDEIKYGLPLTDEQKEILLNQINKEEEKEEVRSFRI